MSKITKEEACEYMAGNGQGGHLSIQLTKKLETMRDLSCGYSPGIAYPCLEIEKDPLMAYKYTSKANFVGMISNGTAVLGIGNIGSLASKPVMEGKCALLKKFANVDAVDVEVETQDVEEFINVVKNIGNTWGGINLEDIKAPECFEIEQRLQDILPIPVFHDDQHGTAVVVLAGIINACEIVNKKIENIKIVINGAGAAAIACTELLKHYGVKHENVTLCDSKGVVYQGRTDGMNKYKDKHAINTKARTLADAVVGCDVLIGVSVKDAFTVEMIQSMAKDPIVFAMANPNPEITPDVAKSAREDVIIGTGRSDYPNQVNNLLCFPYLFRGALDCMSSKITINMKIAVSEALAALAKTDVPEAVLKAYQGREFKFGKDYLIPTPFDPRLIYTIAPAVIKAAVQDGVARKEINIEDYISKLKTGK